MMEILQQLCHEKFQEPNYFECAQKVLYSELQTSKVKMDNYLMDLEQKIDRK